MSFLTRYSLQLTLITFLCGFLFFVALQYISDNTGKNTIIGIVSDSVYSGYSEKMQPSAKPIIIEKMIQLESESGLELTCLNVPKVACFPKLRNWLDSLVARKAKADDEELVRFTRALIDGPSTRPKRKMPWGVEATPQAKHVDYLLNQQSGGFFIEAGAQDGERSSNTKWLEVRRNWTGLLVEIDPWYYTQMRGKARHAYTINACLSPHDYVTELVLKEGIKGGGGTHMIDKKDAKRISDVITLPCLPLQTMLLALNQTTVDYFSLDVEGLEYDVLKEIPYSKLNIRTLSVEYVHTNATGVMDILTSNGYIMDKQINLHKPEKVLFVDDYMFRHPDKT